MNTQICGRVEKVWCGTFSCLYIYIFLHFVSLKVTKYERLCLLSVFLQTCSCSIKQKNPDLFIFLFICLVCKLGHVHLWLHLFSLCRNHRAGKSGVLFVLLCDAAQNLVYFEVDAISEVLSEWQHSASAVIANLPNFNLLPWKVLRFLAKDEED